MIAAAGLPPITTMAINANDVPELLAASSRAAVEGQPPTRSRMPRSQPVAA